MEGIYLDHSGERSPMSKIHLGGWHFPSGNVVRVWLGPAALVTAHVNKLQADQRGAARPFGSVYTLNLPRAAWEIRRAGEEAGETLTVGLYHRKSNRGKLLSPFGLRFEWDATGATRVRSADLTTDPVLQARAGLPFGILAALRSGGLTTPELIERLGESSNSVLKAIQRLEKAGKVIQLEKPAKGRPAKWGLPA